ncbi:MAG: C2 family cysteine protease [Anaerolineae bacterium]|jgi:uncharacterized protein YukE
MPKIRIETERVREVGRRLIAESDRLAEAGHELQSAIGGLDTSAWDGLSRARAEDLLGRVRPESAHVAEKMGGLGRTLVRVADVFEQEDNTAARNLAGMPWVDWDSGGPSRRGRDPDDPDFRRVRGVRDAEYGRVVGQPFIQGRGDRTDIEWEDVAQGQLRDCHLMAAMAGISYRNPDAIREMIHDNGDGTYTVTLYEDAGLFSSELRPVEVVVTPDFPLRDGRPVFAQSGDAAEGRQELWPMLIEKAYAQHHGGYDDIEGGWGHTVLEHLTGTPSEWSSTSDLDFDALARFDEEGYAITASSLADIEILGWDIPDKTDVNPMYTTGRIAANHEYYITQVDREAGAVTLRNPWGWQHGETRLSFEEFQEAFRRVSVNPLDS